MYNGSMDKAKEGSFEGGRQAWVGRGVLRGENGDKRT